MTLSRRTALTWISASTAAATLGACAPQPSSGSAAPTPSPSGGARPTPAPTPTPTPTPTVPAAPDLAAIEERYRTAVPAEWGLHVTGVVNRAPEGSTAIALTFDGCGGSGGSGVDLTLIDALRRREVPATLFLNLRWIEANPELARELAAVPFFELANHGTAHRPLSVSGRPAYGIPGTGSVREVIDEVWTNHEALTELVGRPPRWFRSGTAHYDEVAVRIVGDLGETVVGFDVNGDAGATFDTGTVEASVRSATPGSIVIAHLNQPSSGTARGVDAALDRMLADGAVFGFPDGAVRLAP
ncbi:polysaccharide deacetylase family protein [Agromyces indicus]|uniref:Polysaccharide deacetylase family protein n=1 Tax=Agromyces indicus TaxID=758919 RepID=A0ABU1FG62_9MICO|nr:polysaccharide deacetylase family protein [Agromyces indicus]MDR5690747.1 polysaccharide deacetylase family protein [Agromyces indicus]